MQSALRHWIEEDAKISCGSNRTVKPDLPGRGLSGVRGGAGPVGGAAVHEGHSQQTG